MKIRYHIFSGLLSVAFISFSASAYANPNEMGVWATCNLVTTRIGAKNLAENRETNLQIGREANNRDFIFSSYLGHYTDLCQQYTPQLSAMVSEAQEEFHLYGGKVNDPEGATLFQQRELDLLNGFTEEREEILRKSKEAFDEARKDPQARPDKEKRIKDERGLLHDEREHRLEKEHEDFKKKLAEHNEHARQHTNITK